MRGKASKFLIGIFVTIGIFISVVAIIWLGATRYLQKGDIYVTYFDESVQGLQEASAVKYRGVDVGRVEKIRVAPDNRLVEVVMKIDLEGKLEITSIAQLKSVGITGIVFVDLDRIGPGEAELSPKLTFAAEYPIIPSRPSQVAQVLSGVDVIIAKIKDIDFIGLSDRVKSSATTIENFFGNERLNNLVRDLESTAAKLDKTMTEVEKITAKGRLDSVLTEAGSTLAEARIILGALRDEVRGLKLPDTARKANLLVDDWQRRSRIITEDIETTSENLRRASASLERLMERLNASPSDLIFSSPPPARREE